ncbi:MAG: RsbRD N-terminal domain-containing protein [Terracidiphilus sp.]
MSEDAAIAAAVAEKWIERTFDLYPAEARSSMISVSDPFRNPAGYALKENLTTLAREVLGGMDIRAVEPAIDALVRLRAVQDFVPTEALRFMADLRTVIADMAGPIPNSMNGRIDELERMALEKYSACREQIAGLREKERRFRAQCEAL